jgi:hypothetical protein
MMRHFHEGRTKHIDTQILGNGLPFDASGMTLAIELRDRTGALFTPTGAVSWLDITQSKVRFTPGATDLTVARSPIGVYFKLTAGADVDFAPTGEGDEWIIHPRKYA